MDFKKDHIVLIEVPEDNDCLFHCVNETCFGGKETIESLREICALQLSTCPKYAEFFGWSEEETIAYVAQLMKKGFWGSYIELLVFSLLKEVEFIVFSGATKDFFQKIKQPEDGKYKKKVFLYWCSTKKSKDPSRLVHYNYFGYRSRNINSKDNRFKTNVIFSDNRENDQINAVRKYLNPSAEIFKEIWLVCPCCNENFKKEISLEVYEKSLQLSKEYEKQLEVLSSSLEKTQVSKSR